MKKKKIILIISIILVVFIALFLINRFYLTGKIIGTGKGSQQIQVTISPLTSSEHMQVQRVIESSNFIKDMPKNGIISLRFFNFVEGNRVWQDEFLIGKSGVLSSGQPDFYIILHSKYISELNSQNLCDVTQRANKNGDLGFYSEHSTASLFLKYAGMLKYRKCFGF
jgi:hypothetical protein